jgi:signal transduction histidine kinase
VGDRGVLGGLWLINQADDCFSEPDIRLVQQVANQCAIALRQSWLYQAAQSQVTELERLNRLKDDFLSTVSHELRTPMASIKMAIEMLELTLFSEENTGTAANQPQGLTIDPPNFQKVKRYFQFLKDGCQQEINLINNLLDLTRLDAEAKPLDFVRTDLPDLIAHIAQPFVECARRQQQQLLLDLPLTLPTLMTEPAYLERILTELLNNACKYTPAGETITISARACLPSGYEPEAQRHCNGSQDGRTGCSSASRLAVLQLEITNTGVEIPIEEHNRIFDKFYRIPNNDPWKHGGTGLGLALVKKLVHHLGGTIQVQTGDRQTSFRLHFLL